MKLAVFLPNWVGDAVMATPALRAIRNHHRDAEIVAVLRRPIDEVLAGTGLVDRVLIHSPRGSDPWQRGLRFALRLRAEAFDVAILFPNSLRTAGLAFVSGAKRRIGFSRDRRGRLLTDALTPKPRDVPHPVIDEYLRIAAHLGCEELSRKAEIAVLPDDEQRFETFRRSLPHELQSRPLITLNPGGAFGSGKHWPTQHFATLAQRIGGELGHLTLVLCGPAERDQAREIVRLASHPLVASLADEILSIGLTKAAVRASSLLVTTDSGPRHFAAPFGVPAVTLFGPTHIAWSETFSKDAVHLQVPVECGPCQQRVCPLGHHKCMVDLSVDRVFEAVQTVLHRRLRDAA
ncbi:MAG: lipopolysaccharide heptosyltransferase II [Planctomycetota bacterium]|nr:lipopolysaccharide heptosyltransferase II [Planctomycetaceae bacterium]MDQ3332019.1 lipopolysaccharide heptosyltransferase II [Planctomycetota bacterium]